MDENLDQTIPDDVISDAGEHKAPGRLDRLMINHPRAAKVFALTGAAAAALAGGKLVKNVHNNRSHLSAATDHAGEAVAEVTASVSTPDTENA